METDNERWCREVTEECKRKGFKPRFRWCESLSGGFWISYDFDFPTILD